MLWLLLFVWFVVSRVPQGPEVTTALLVRPLDDVIVLRWSPSALRLLRPPPPPPLPILLLLLLEWLTGLAGMACDEEDEDGDKDEDGLALPLVLNLAFLRGLYL